MTCPTCGAAMRLDPDQQSFNCEFCGTLRQPAPNKDGVRVGPPSEHSCTLCESALVFAELGRQEVLYCPNCGGVLVMMQGFMPLIATLRAERETVDVPPRPINPDSLERRMRCPRCRGAMHTHLYGGPGAVVIDTCERCEVNWLDRGEISRIATAPDRSRWTSPVLTD